MVEISKDVIRAFALENAIKYNGSANPGAVISGLFSVGLEKSEMKNYAPIINRVVKDVNSLELDKQEKEFEKVKDLVSKRVIREGLPELENAEKGKVIMRIAPYPSGPLHIGNSRQVLLNDEYCKMYGGKYILAMDDTIGNEAKPIEPAAYDLIK